MSTVIFPIPKIVQFGENTEMLKEILQRIDSRLGAVGLTESAAATKAGLSNSAIRDIRRAVKAGEDKRGVSSNTLIALASVLDTTAAWLLEECGPEHVPGETRQIQKLLIQMARMPREARERIIDQLEWEISRYEKSRETAT